MALSMLDNIRYLCIDDEEYPDYFLNFRRDIKKELQENPIYKVPQPFSPWVEPNQFYKSLGAGRKEFPWQQLK